MVASATAQFPLQLRVQPPMRFTSDADFALHGLPGSGTRDDPYVLEGRTVLVPETPTGANMGHDPMLAPGILFQGTRAHVVVRDTTFVPEPRWAASAAPAPQPGTWPAVALSSASNVTVERSHFVGVGGAWGVVYATRSDVRVFDSQFVDAAGSALQSEWSSTQFSRNRVETSGWSALRYGWGGGNIVIEDNVLESPGEGIDVWQHDPYSEIVIARNVMRGMSTGMSLSVASPTLVVDNKVDADELCIVARYPETLLVGNAFTGCSRGALLGSETFATLGAGNTLHGKPMLLLRDAAHVDIDAAGLGWLNVVDSEDVTIRNLDLAANAGYVFVRNVTGLTLEDGSILGRLELNATDVTLRRMTAPYAHLDVSGDVLLDEVVADGGWVQLHMMESASVLVTRSTFARSWQMGISVLFSGGCSDLRVDNSTFHASDFAGLHFYLGVPSCNTVVVRGSSFTSHYYAGIWVQSGGTVDARENWWGAAAGPRTGHSSWPSDGALAEDGSVILVDPWLAAKP